MTNTPTQTPCVADDELPDHSEPSPGRGWLWPWPDADWTTLSRLTTGVVYESIADHPRLYRPDELHPRVRDRVFPFLSRLPAAKGHWLDGNLEFLTNLTCRRLLKSGELVRVVLAYRTDACGRRCCKNPPPQTPAGCYMFGLVSAVGAPGCALDINPRDGWQTRKQVPVPRLWAAWPLVDVSVNTRALLPGAWGPASGGDGATPFGRIPDYLMAAWDVPEFPHAADIVEYGRTPLKRDKEGAYEDRLQAHSAVLRERIEASKRGAKLPRISTGEEMG